MRGERRQHLDPDRAETDQQRAGEERRRTVRQPRADETERGERDRGERQAAVLDQIGKRNDQQQAGAVAELGQRETTSPALRGGRPSSAAIGAING
jgi:hypothetical protein